MWLAGGAAVHSRVRATPPLLHGVSLAMTQPERRPRLGLALGAGAARGWAHIGVLRALREAGIEPDVVAGTSAGALVGGIYAAGRLDELEQWVRSLTRVELFTLFDSPSRAEAPSAGGA